MWLLSWLWTRALPATSAAALRLVSARLRMSPAVVAAAAAAAAALLYVLRGRRGGGGGGGTGGGAARDARAARRRAAVGADAHGRGAREDARAADKPRWLARVHVVTMGAVCSRAQRGALFCRREEAVLEAAAMARGGADGGGACKEHMLDDAAQIPELPFVVRPALVRALRRFAELFDLFVVVRVDDDDGEQLVTRALHAAGLFEPGLLHRSKLLFCETDTGRISVARQLEPQLHVDETVAVVTGLQRFVHFVALVTSDADACAAAAQQPLGSNVARFSSLASFFAPSPSS